MPPLDSPQQRGAAAEQQAVDYLQNRGFVLMLRNFRCRAGELDLVGLDGEVLAIVEVRQRSGARFGGALASVSVAKRRRIIRAAGFFLLRQLEPRCRAMRFDVLALDGPPHGAQRILWHKDAFRAT